MTSSNFSAFSALEKAFQVLVKNFKFFGVILILYIIVSVAPYLYLFGGVDFTDPASVMDMATGGNLFLTAVSILFYLLYAFMFVLVLDKTNSSLNGLNFNDYPYGSRALQTVIPVILIYIMTAVLVFIGLLLFIIPGLIVAAGLYIAVPAKLAENISFYSSLSRSWQLTKGHRLSIWGMILIPVVPMLIISFILMGFVVSQTQSGDGLNVAVSPLFLTINAAVGGLFTIYFMIASGVAYHQIAENEDPIES